MSNSIADREARLVKRFPELAKVPPGQRLDLAIRAALHPSVWGTATFVLLLLIPPLAYGTFYVQAHFRPGKSTAMAAAALGIMCLAILLPLTFHMQGRVIKRLISRRSGNQVGE